MGHIPVKMEVIGMTVGATNEYIKELLNKDFDYFGKSWLFFFLFAYPL